MFPLLGGLLGRGAMMRGAEREMAETGRTLLIAASKEGIRRAAADVDAFSAANHLAAGAVWPIQVALDEMLSNIVHHGYEQRDQGRQIEIQLRLQNGVVEMTIIDDAAPFNPLISAEPDTTRPAAERPVGGLGIHLVKKLMDSVEYERREGRNRLRCRKRVEG